MTNKEDVLKFLADSAKRKSIFLIVFESGVLSGITRYYYLRKVNIANIPMHKLLRVESVPTNKFCEELMEEELYSERFENYMDDLLKDGGATSYPLVFEDANELRKFLKEKMKNE